MAQSISEEAARVRERIDGTELSAADLADARQQVEERVEAHRSVGVIWLAPLVAAGVAAALAVVLWPTESRWVDVHAECISASATRVVTGAACNGEIEVGPDRVELDPGTALERVPAGLRFGHGSARFRISKRRTGESPFVLEVAAGRIVVLGTSFGVRQRDDAGRVRVSSGRVRFEWSDGKHETLGPGQELSWRRPEPVVELEPVVEPDADPEAEAPQKRHAKRRVMEHDLNEVMRRMFLLRSQKRYADAVELLRNTYRRRDLGAQQRARLSYEIGTLLDDRLENADAACGHWREHARRYPRDHADNVRGRLERCP